MIYRAERIILCARLIIKDFNGQVPDSEEHLKKLPGVGQYISNAVLCYAYGKPTVPIDTNVIRLFTRFYGLKSIKTRPRTDPFLAEEIKKRYTSKDYQKSNMAILDFSGLVCTAIPKCEECILQKQCFHY